MYLRCMQSATIAVGIMMLRGCTLIVKPKFSVRSFWPDVSRSRATVVQYIGATPAPRRVVA
jgi:hypothetical protein